ncbi:class I SAM-dependent methyltransferase [Catenulispora pinisilvae]|uniref:class I SAM-dependent methyltransferase n=1 Tax=Catenulispora pinisilvae TaxID=2705253 RepID=UPI0018916121|nr:class I SAM-dependent methyltransferase [Catenulispora pinisilvae]
MRLALRGGNLLERLALRANLVPGPAAEAWGGMATSGVLVAAVRTGVVARLASSPARTEDIARDLCLALTPTRLLVDCLIATGHARRARDGSVRLARRDRRWLDPESEMGVARFVNACGDYFDWWRDLDRLIETGASVEQHDRGPDDPYWRRYILGQLDLARLTAPEVARRLVLPDGAGSVLDVGGGHGWYSAMLCRRHPGLTATVLDLPGSARIGREVVDAAGLAHRVTFVEGDARSADFPDGQDAVLCFNLLHHLTETEIPALFTRAAAALKPGGTLAVLDAFAEPPRPGRARGNAAATHLALFVRLTSGSTVHTPSDLATWLRAAGFAAPRRVRSARIPGLALYQAWKSW